MTGVNLAQYGDAFVHNPSTWVWLLIAVLGVAACFRVLLLVEPDSWFGMGVMAIMGWIMVGCLLDLAFAGPVLGHFGDVLHWQIGAFCAVWMVGGYWLVTRLTNWLWRSKPDSPIH